MPEGVRLYEASRRLWVDPVSGEYFHDELKSLCEQPLGTLA